MLEKKLKHLVSVLEKEPHRYIIEVSESMWRTASGEYCHKLKFVLYLAHTPLIKESLYITTDDKEIIAENYVKELERKIGYLFVPIAQHNNIFKYKIVKHGQSI